MSTRQQILDSITLEELVTVCQRLGFTVTVGLGECQEVEGTEVEANDNEIGRAAHEAWKIWIVSGGYADHAFVVMNNSKADYSWPCAVCHCVSERHHSDMVPYDNLPPEKRAKYIATGRAGYNLRAKLREA